MNDNYDPNQAAADALKAGMTAQNNIQVVLSVISNQVERLKAYQGQIKGLFLTNTVLDTILTRVKKVISKEDLPETRAVMESNDTQKQAELDAQDEAIVNLIDEFRDAIKTPDLKPGSPDELEKQVQEWIKATEKKEEDGKPN